jgi:transcriptional regulator with XRE-family HTH domain
MNTGQATRQLREKIGDSQQAFSNRLGVTVTTISRWENNRVTPEPSYLAALSNLARTYGMTVEAETLESEAGVLFKMMGRDMLANVDDLAGGVVADISTFSAEIGAYLVGREVPVDIWNRLDAAITAANEIRSEMRNLLAMVPKTEPIPADRKVLTIPEGIKQLREGLGYTQDLLAKLLSVGQLGLSIDESTVQQWEAGSVSPVSALPKLYLISQELDERRDLHMLFKTGRPVPVNPTTAGDQGKF